jgi:hypothetical protein
VDTFLCCLGAAGAPVGRCGDLAWVPPGLRRPDPPGAHAVAPAARPALGSAAPLLRAPLAIMNKLPPNARHYWGRVIGRRFGRAGGRETKNVEGRTGLPSALVGFLHWKSAGWNRGVEMVSERVLQGAFWRHGRLVASKGLVALCTEKSG